jgi:DNA polymerase-3 subunit alpha
MGAGFIHLHTHSEYSLLDGAARVKDMVAKAADLGMPALALTDHGVMYGAIDFYREAKKAGIKPIIGCEVYVAPRSRMDRQPRIDDQQCHLVLLARNQEGYKNLTELVSRAYLEGFYYKPRVDHELLEKYAGGLLALSACLNGEIPEKLLAGRYGEARNLACYYRDVFGPGNFYLEVQDHGIREQREVNEQIWRLSEDLGIPVVATNDIHYLDREDAFVHDVLLCIQTGKTISDPARMKFSTEEFYFKSADEMLRLFPDHPEALTNTLEVAARCSLDFEFGTFLLPHYEVPPEHNAESYLRQLVKDRLSMRFRDPGPEIFSAWNMNFGSSLKWALLNIS